MSARNLFPEANYKRLLALVWEALGAVGSISPLAGGWPPTDTHASGLVVISSLAPLRKFDGTGGVVTYGTPTTPFDGQVIGIKPAIAANAGATLTATNFGAGETVEFATNSGNYGQVSNIPGQGAACFWKYEAATKKWIGLINV